MQPEIDGNLGLNELVTWVTVSLSLTLVFLRSEDALSTYIKQKIIALC